MHASIIFHTGFASEWVMRTRSNDLTTFKKGHDRGFQRGRVEGWGGLIWDRVVCFSRGSNLKLRKDRSRAQGTPRILAGGRRLLIGWVVGWFGSESSWLFFTMTLHHAAYIERDRCVKSGIYPALYDWHITDTPNTKQVWSYLLNDLDLRLTPWANTKGGSWGNNLCN